MKTFKWITAVWLFTAWTACIYLYGVDSGKQSAQIAIVAASR
jgi:hypothetical protein